VKLVLGGFRSRKEVSLNENSERGLTSISLARVSRMIQNKDLFFLIIRICNSTGKWQVPSQGYRRAFRHALHISQPDLLGSSVPRVKQLRPKVIPNLSASLEAAGRKKEMRSGRHGLTATHFATSLLPRPCVRWRPHPRCTITAIATPTSPPAPLGREIGGWQGAQA
jgi:hypothetical protein